MEAVSDTGMALRGSQRRFEGFGWLFNSRGRMRLKGKNKYGAKKTEIDGIIFDSKREASRYQDLRLLEKAKEIRDIRLQVKYNLDVNGVRISTYKADFVYWDLVKKCEIVEDCKGYPNDRWPMKKKLMRAIHGIEILET